MSALILRLLPYGAVLAVIVLIWSLWQTIDAQNQALAAHQGEVKRLVQNVDLVIDQNRKNAEGLEDLLLSQQKVSRTLSSRTLEIRRLQSDVEEIRQWADQPLPDHIVRLRTRRAITGAAGYSAAVPAGGAVRSQPDEPAK